MSKKDEFLFKAQQLYTIQGLTLEEISSRLGITVRTLYEWSKDNDWKSKKQQFIKDKTNFSEEVYSFYMTVQKSIQDDLSNGIEPSLQRVKLLDSLAKNIEKLKKYEAELKTENSQTEKQESKNNVRILTTETLNQIHEHLGL